MLYLDNNATTKPDNNMLGAAVEVVSHLFGNPSSLHSAGDSAKDSLEHSREKVAKAIGAKNNEIVFTSGGTEANNIALKHYIECGFEVAVSTVEHSSVFNIGASATIPVDHNCELSFDALETWLKANESKKCVVSVMHANNETGSILDPNKRLLHLKNKYNFILHVDAVQSFTKIPISLYKEHEYIDLLSVSAHKIYGLKGSGALFIRDSLKRKPRAIMRGGAHERAFRPGTENDIGIFSLGYMAEKLTENEFIKCQVDKVKKARDELEQSLADVACVNGNENRIFNTTNLWFHDVDDLDLFLEILSENGICVSGKSACSSGMPIPSRVIRSMYPNNPKRADGSVRFSLSLFDSHLDVDKVSALIKQCILNFKEMKDE